MPSKCRKLLAGISDRLRLNGDDRVFYHLGRPNFGDDMNPWFFGRISGRDFRWGRTDRSHVLGIGSIAGKLSPHSVVMGSGFIQPVSRAQLARPARVLALRGELSAEILDETPAYLGDPLSLINLLLPEPSSTAAAPLGFVPHAVHFREYQAALRRRTDIVLIDPRAAPLQVVAAIARCGRVASQSLHGLIVADAYGIPNLWIAPSPAMVGGEFKFRDYFTTLDGPKLPVAPADFLADPGRGDFSVGRYRHDKTAYLRALTDAVGGPLS